MEENKTIQLTQRDYQRKYDEKTKMISIKYVLKDMDDYYKLMRYLEKTGQSTNGFIKALIREFFENGRDLYSFPPPKACEKMEFYKFYEIGDECHRKLRNVLGNDDEKYNAILDLYADYTKSEIETALFDKACEFEEWVDTLEERINDGAIAVQTIERFKKDVEKSICNNLSEVIYG